MPTTPARPALLSLWLAINRNPAISSRREYAAATDTIEALLARENVRPEDCEMVAWLCDWAAHHWRKVQEADVEMLGRLDWGRSTASVGQASVSSTASTKELA